MIYSHLPNRRAQEGLLASGGLGLPLSLIFPPTCGTDTFIQGTVTLIGGTVMTPAGAKMAVVGAKVVPTGLEAVPTGARMSIAGTRTPPTGSEAVTGADSRPDGTDDDLGDDILSGSDC